jgi:hypothetical protein
VYIYTCRCLCIRVICHFSFVGLFIEAVTNPGCRPYGVQYLIKRPLKNVEIFVAEHVILLWYYPERTEDNHEMC